MNTNAMEYPLISVIVPVFNTERYLEQCVKSIQNQTYEHLEIILVDDGSLDNSGTLCDKYAEEDSRVIVIHQTNQGPSRARNQGLEIAHGDYLAFIDSDDYIDSRMIESLLLVLTQNEADLAICNFARFSGDTITEDLKVIPEEVLSKTAALSIIENGSWHYIPVWNKLYKKQIFQSLRFPEGRLHEDEAIIHWVFNASNRIVSIKDTLYYYRHSENSIMSNGISLKRMKDLNYAIIDRIHYYESIGNSQSALHTAYILIHKTIRYYYHLIVGRFNIKAKLSIRIDVLRLWFYLHKKQYLSVKESGSIIIFVLNPMFYKRKWGMPFHNGW